MQTVTSADGTRIAYEVHGDEGTAGADGGAAGVDRPPLVLLHGDSTSDYWDPVVPRFANDRTVVAPDRRGLGASGDGEAYSLQREVEDATAVVEAVDGTPVVFGHSFGGLQAVELARQVDVVALVAYEPAVLVGEYREQADLADRMQAALDADGRRAAMRLHVEEILHGGEADDLDAWLDEWPPWPDYAERAEHSIRMNRAIERYELPDQLDVDAPALVLTGTEGPPHLRESARAVAASLADSRLVELDGVSHFGPSEAPGRTARAVRSFLRERGHATV